jgi:peptidoglycan hydrolase CwlO-like protein
MLETAEDYQKIIEAALAEIEDAQNVIEETQKRIDKAVEQLREISYL